MPVSPPAATASRRDDDAAVERRLTLAHRRFAVAPMMELTDRHYRHLARLLSAHALLWTEMLTARAVIHGDRERLLGDGPERDAHRAAARRLRARRDGRGGRVGEAWGYDEVNINVGCPSDRVQSGRFGACLMAEPALVAANVRAMRDAVGVPVTVKCRLGIDRDDSYEALEHFVRHVADAGCEHVIVHARKAWLDGLSPKENRSIPPLRPEHVYRLKAALPELHVTVNGGIGDWPSIRTPPRARRRGDARPPRLLHAGLPRRGRRHAVPRPARRPRPGARAVPALAASPAPTPATPRTGSSRA